MPWRGPRPTADTDSVSLPIVDDLISGFADATGDATGSNSTATSPDNYELNIEPGTITGEFPQFKGWVEVATFNCGQPQDFVPEDYSAGDISVQNGVLMVYKGTRGSQTDLEMNAGTVTSL